MGIEYGHDAYVVPRDDGHALVFALVKNIFLNSNRQLPRLYWSELPHIHLMYFGTYTKSNLLDMPPTGDLITIAMNQ